MAYLRAIQHRRPVQPSANAAKFGFYEWAILLPLFIVTSTHLEIAADERLAGVAFFIRAVAGLLFLVALTMKIGLPINKYRLFVIIEICLYFIAVNLLQFTFFAIMGTVFIFWGLVVGSLGVGNWQGQIDFYIRNLLIFHLVGFMLAVGIYGFSGQIIDLHNLAFPFSASRAGIMLDQVRLSGFQIEPGTYSNATYAFVVMRALMRRKIYNRLDMVLMLSTLATLAAWAVIGAGFYFLALAIELFKYDKSVSTSLRLTVIYSLLAVTFVALPVLLTLFWENDFVQKMIERFSGQSGKGSAEFKYQALQALEEAFGLRMLFGHPLPDTFCPDCEALQDLGTVLNMFYYFGLVATLLLVVACIKNLARHWSLAFVPLFAPFFVTKFFCYDPIIWLVFGMMLFGGRQLSETDRYNSRKWPTGRIAPHRKS
jgi:hypothetical protein